jgi:uncharacterized membrane protein
MGKGRVEAFSDGVLAVAITLLVLDLKVDTGSRQSLAHQLAKGWPSFAAYAVSFFTIGVIWVNHHAVFSLAERVDRVVIFDNLMLLLFVTTIPFTTSTLASYLRADTADSRLAVLLYGASLEGMAISYTLILWHLIKRGLLTRPVSAAEGRRAVWRFGLGTGTYPVVTAVGLLSPVVALILFAALTAFYVAEQTRVLPSAGDEDRAANSGH